MPEGLVRDAVLASPAWPDIAAAMARLDAAGIDVARILTDAHRAGAGVDQAVAAVTAAPAAAPAPAPAASAPVEKRNNQGWEPPSDGLLPAPAALSTAGRAPAAVRGRRSPPRSTASTPTVGGQLEIPSGGHSVGWYLAAEGQRCPTFRRS